MRWRTFEITASRFLGIEYLELALKRGLNRDSESLEAVSAVYSQLGNAYYALKDFDMALHYHDLDLETAKYFLCPLPILLNCLSKFYFCSQFLLYSSAGYCMMNLG